MMEAYGRAVIEERLNPRRFAELAAYVRSEYGSGIGPGFLLAELGNGAVRKPRKRRDATPIGVFRTLANALKALVPGHGNGRKPKALTPAR